MAAYEDRVEGELVRFSFRADDGGWAVGRLRPHKGVREVIVVGNIGHITEGQFVKLDGRWQEHATYGRQFRVEAALLEDPRTLRGLERYLASDAVQGLGKEFARRVVERFGLDTLRVIEEDPKRLTEVEGIGQRRMEEIVAHWERDRANREVHAQLRGYGIGQALAHRIVEQYGKDAVGIVASQPYRLAAEVRGVGFRTADVIAREAGIPRDHPERAEAALVHTLEEAAGQGHCFLPAGELLDRVGRLDVPADAAHQALDRLCLLGGAHGARLVQHVAQDAAHAPVYLPRLDTAEHRVGQDLLRLVGADLSPATADLDTLQEQLKITLAAGQARAVRTALQGGVTVITGGPGTGKTTIVRVLVEAARRSQEKWLLAAPTGRAAKRLAEATGVEAKTLHRLLEFNGGTFTFTRDRGNPLDAEGVLIDESSMVDVALMDKLLSALPDGCRLVLVGDADQLPSVGPGQVLADVIASGAVPVVTLTEVYRQAADSAIVQNAHRILQGLPPVSAEKARARPTAVRDGEDAPAPLRDDFFVVPRDEAGPAQQALLQIVSERLGKRGFDPMDDVQVLTPMHSGPLGTIELNRKLQALLNPDGAPLKRTKTAEGRKAGMRVGDRVIQVRNDYDNDVFNGDVGRVVGIEGGVATIDFAGPGEPSQPVEIKGEKLDNVELAYAVSIHKSQGSEYPAVVVALHRSHRVMLQRNLLYTAVTRARKFCCIVGSPWAIGVAVGARSGAQRWTRLAERLRGD